MLGELNNHLWQSTAFAILAGLMTVAFRQNRAQVRYWLWLGASFKFLLPFSLLMSLGNRLEWSPAIKNISATPALALTMAQISQPFSDTLPLGPPMHGPRDFTAIAIFGVWVCGFVAIALLRYRGWRRIRAAVRSSTPISIPAAIEVRSSTGLLEPGVVGLFRPVLLLPADIATRLTPTQWRAVLAHELCHVRRRDNLFSAVHMIVEACFWFHPLVWWIGARLMEERERACDEAVLNLGSTPQDYAQGILNVCKSYLESPLRCVSGVTGSNLKKRLQVILTGRVPAGLNFAKKLALGLAATAAIVAPIVVGMLDAPAISALSSTVGAPKFEVAVITRCGAFRHQPVPESPGRLQSGCTTLQQFIQQAYGPFANGHMNPLASVAVTGGPAWDRSEFYQIDAKAGRPQSSAMMKGPMLQALLEDRFKLKVHRETREVPVYDLTVAGGGPQLQPFHGTCIPWDADDPPASRKPEQMCGRVVHFTKNGFDFNAAAMVDLCFFFDVTLDRRVIDKTGISGKFDFHLEVPTEDLRRGARGLPGTGDPNKPAPSLGPSFVSAAETAVKKLGMNLEPASGPGEFIVIDHVERPSLN